MTNEQVLVSKPDSVTITVGSNFEGIIDSGNNINIQVQENSSNNVGDSLVKEICIQTLLFSKDILKSRIVK